jgi:hypothetical protein
MYPVGRLQSRPKHPSDTNFDHDYAFALLCRERNIAGGTMIACVEAEDIDASGARVAESDINRRRDRAVRHLL